MSSDSLLERIANALIRIRIWLLFIWLAVGVAAFFPSRNLAFDRSVEGLFSPDDPRFASYREDKALFGNIEKAVVAYSDPDLISVEGLDRLEAFRAKLLALEGVDEVTGLTQAKLPGAPLSKLSLHEHLERGKISPDAIKQALTESDVYRGTLISADGETTVLLVSLAPVGESSVPRAELVQRLSEVVDAHEPHAVVGGAPVVVEEIFRHLEMDGHTLGIASSLILTLVIGLLFRNLRWLILPLAVVQLTLVLTKASLVLSGTQLSMVSSPLVALVTVIGVATVVHVTIRYGEERREHDPFKAMQQTMVHIGPAVFWTCMTTAAGFLALMASRVVPVRSFGSMMALGSMLVFVATLGLLPGVVLIGRRHTDPGTAPGEKKVTRLLGRIVSAVDRRPIRTAVVAILMLTVTGLGALRLDVATDFDENFRESHPIVVSYRFLADRMGSVSMFDVMIDGPDKNDPEAMDAFLKRVRELQTTLVANDGVSGSLSVVDVLDFVNDSKPEWAEPAERVQAAMFKALTGAQSLELLNGLQPKLMAGFWNFDENVFRIILRTEPIHGPESKRELIEAVEQQATQAFPDARVAGVEVLLAFMVQSLLADQWVTFSWAVAAILLMMMIAFRDWRLGLIALVPNVAPIVIVMGVMGWAGLKLNTATAMLASVSMGLAVDFSIHYLYRFRHERRDGRSVAEAARSAHGSVGLAMVLANFALIAGFSALTISSFIPTVHFGILVSVAMLGGLIGNLTILPLLLRLVYR